MALSLHAGAEAEVDDGDGGPGDETADRGEVGKVVEGGGSASGDSHVREEGEEDGDNHRDPGKTVAVGLGKEARSLARDGETVEGTRRGVHVRGGSADSRGEQAGVDDRGKTLDTSSLDGNDKGRASGGLAGVGELGGVGGADDRDGECSEDVEEENTVEDLADGRRDGLPGVACLTSGHADDLGTDEAEGRVDENGPEAEELAEGAGDVVVLDKGTGVLPVLEAEAALLADGTDVDEEREDDQTDDGEDLDACEPELGLSVSASTEEVDRDDDDEAGRDEDGGRGIGPEGAENGGGREFGGEDDRPVVPVVPTHGKGHGRRDEAVGQLDVTTGDGQVGEEFTEALHHGVADGAHDAVAEPQAQRTTVVKRASSTKEETYSKRRVTVSGLSLGRYYAITNMLLVTNHTSDTDHSYVAGLESVGELLALALVEVIVLAAEGGATLLEGADVLSLLGLEVALVVGFGVNHGCICLSQVRCVERGREEREGRWMRGLEKC